MQALSSEIKLKVRLKKGLGLPCHGIETSSDQTNTSLLHGRARHRLGWTQREEQFLPQADKRVIPSCRLWHLTTVSPSPASV